MESQERSSIRGRFVETTFIRYTVHDRSNTRPTSSEEYESLADAVNAYWPDAKLSLMIAQRIIELDVGRDMYGLHRDLLGLLEHIQAGGPGRGPYREAIGSMAVGTPVYTVVLTEFHDCPILYFSLVDDFISVQTRTLSGEEVIVGDDDVADPVLYDKKAFLHNCISFLQEYLQDLGGELPVVRDLPEYEACLRTLRLLSAGA